LRVINAEWPKNPFFNLAFEEAFLLANEPPALRLWRNDRVIVIGRFQCAALEVNAVEAYRLNVKLVRRFTGGGEVYHDLGNVNYAIVLSEDVGGVVEAFKLVGDLVSQALNSLGVKARYRPLNDIEVNGRKISGLAACRVRGKLFVHGAMLVSSDLSILWRVLKASKEKLLDKKFVGSKVKRVITLEEALGRRVGIEEVYKAITDSLADTLKDHPIWDKPRKAELKLAYELYQSKYSKIEWNLRYLKLVREHIDREELEALLAIAKPGEEEEKAIREVVAGAKDGV